MKSLIITTVAVVSLFLVPPGSTRMLSSAKHATLSTSTKLHQSESLVNWYQHKGKWTLHPAQKSCYGISLFQGRMQCIVARRNLRWHQRRIERLQSTIEEEQFARLDSDIYLANHFAARLFGVSESLLNEIVGGEGGDISSQTLAATLCSGGQPGWNNWGSDAFGPYQFMLDSKPACGGGWGTFGSNDDSAFAAAAQRGVVIPSRYDTPASNLGQAITGAHMVLTGGIGPWCSSMC